MNVMMNNFRGSWASSNHWWRVDLEASWEQWHGSRSACCAWLFHCTDDVSWWRHPETAECAAWTITTELLV